MEEIKKNITIMIHSMLMRMILKDFILDQVVDMKVLVSIMMEEIRIMDSMESSMEVGNQQDMRQE